MHHRCVDKRVVECGLMFASLGLQTACLLDSVSNKFSASPCASRWPSVPYAMLTLNRKRALSKKASAQFALSPVGLAHPFGLLSPGRRGLCQSTNIQTHTRTHTNILTVFLPATPNATLDSLEEATVKGSLEPKSLRLCTTVYAKMYFPGPSQLTRS